MPRFIPIVELGLRSLCSMAGWTQIDVKIKTANQKEQLRPVLSNARLVSRVVDLLQVTQWPAAAQYSRLFLPIPKTIKRGVATLQDENTVMQCTDQSAEDSTGRESRTSSITGPNKSRLRTILACPTLPSHGFLATTAPARRLPPCRGCERLRRPSGTS